MKRDFPIYFQHYIEQFPSYHTAHFIDLTYCLLQIFWSKGLLDDIPELDIPFVAMAAGLHDLGKSALAPSIAYHTGALTPAERAVYESHTILGAAILSSIELPGFQDTRFYNYSEQICLSHHERWDGNGYPQGLKGEQLPAYIQIVSLANQYDFLRTPRCNRSAYPHNKAMERILDDRGAFDPQILTHFIYTLDANLAASIYPKNSAKCGQNQSAPSEASI